MKACKKIELPIKYKAKMSFITQEHKNKAIKNPQEHRQEFYKGFT